jgi:hypothetical protein
MDSGFAQPIDLGMTQFKPRIVVLLLCQRGLKEGLIDILGSRTAR